MEGTLQTPRYYSGLSGIQLPLPKYLFPQEHQNSSRLEYYSTFFNSIEINSTFYKLPLQVTLCKWHNCVSENFKFTFKFWRQVTHNKGLLFTPSDVTNFLEIVNNIGVKKGCLLLQFPPSFRVQSIDQLALLLSEIRESDPKYSWNIAIEFRNDSWYHQDVYTLAAFYKSLLVIHDKAGKPSPFSLAFSDIVYVRFHGPSGNYRGSYEKDFLSEYASYIKEWLMDKKTVYVYFNNTMGDAFNNLTTLNSFLNNSLK